MKQMSSYPVRISRCADIRKTLSATAGIYRRAVDFFISVCMEEWDTVSASKGQTGKVNAVEAFTIKTSKRKTVPYDFGKDFYKFPSYLRRAAIAQAVWAPADTDVEASRSTTRVGYDWLYVLPSPTCPSALLPQQ